MGDFDADGKVDFADFVVLTNLFEFTKTDLQNS